MLVLYTRSNFKCRVLISRVVWQLSKDTLIALRCSKHESALRCLDNEVHMQTTHAPTHTRSSGMAVILYVCDMLACRINPLLSLDVRDAKGCKRCDSMGYDSMRRNVV